MGRIFRTYGLDRFPWDRSPGSFKSSTPRGVRSRAGECTGQRGCSTQPSPIASGGGLRIRTREGSTTTTHPVKSSGWVSRMNSSTNLFTASGPSVRGRKSMTPGWVPGAYFLMLPNSTSRVSRIRSSSLAAAATMVSGDDRRFSSATVAVSWPSAVKVGRRWRDRFSSNLIFNRSRNFPDVFPG